MLRSRRVGCIGLCRSLASSPGRQVSLCAGRAVEAERVAPHLTWSARRLVPRRRRGLSTPLRLRSRRRCPRRPRLPDPRDLLSLQPRRSARLESGLVCTSTSSRSCSTCRPASWKPRSCLEALPSTAGRAVPCRAVPCRAASGRAVPSRALLCRAGRALRPAPGRAGPCAPTRPALQSGPPGQQLDDLACVRPRASVLAFSFGLPARAAPGQAALRRRARSAAPLESEEPPERAGSTPRWFKGRPGHDGLSAMAPRLRPVRASAPEGLLWHVALYYSSAASSSSSPEHRSTRASP